MNFWLQVPPPVYAIILLGLGKIMDKIFPFPVDFSAPELAVLLMVMGVGLTGWAWAHFLAKRTTPMPTAMENTLVREGPYRFTRNPMYLGLMAMLAGIVLWLGSPYYFLSLPGLFFILDRVFIPHEEAKLEQRFGADYARLRSAVRRWL